MFAFILAFVVTICSAEEVGKIVKILGGSDAYIMRSGQKINAAVDLGLELKDEVHASDSVVVLHVFPSS